MIKKPRILPFFAVVLLAVGIIALFLVPKEINNGSQPIPGQTDAPYDDDSWREWYLAKVSSLGQDEIIASVKEAKAIAEYRIVVEYSLLGYNYYSLQEFEDGTGRFTFMIVGDLYSKRPLINESKDIDQDTVQTLRNAIRENRFWKIPTVHPDEKIAPDGWTICVEGCEAGSTHFIHMYSPGKQYGIYNLFKAFDDYSKKVAENPFADIQKEYE